MKRIALFIGIFLYAGWAYAAPSISSLSGTPGDGNALTIDGSDFFNHPDSAGNQKPTLFDDFEDNNETPSSLGKMTAYNSDTTDCISVATSDPAEGTYYATSDMTECFNFVEGGFHLTASDGVSLPIDGYLTISLHRYPNTSDADRSENWKQFRPAKDSDFSAQNWYIGESPDDDPNWVREPSGDGDYLGGSYTELGSGWIQEAYIMQRESTATGTDGELHIIQNSNVVFSTTSADGFYMNEKGASAGTFDSIRVGDDLSNDRESTTGSLNYDMIYVDTMTPVLVMLINASAYASATEAFPQPYSAMSTTEITIEQKGVTALGGDADSIWVGVCKFDECATPVKLSTASGDPDPIPSKPTNNGFMIFGAG